MPIVVARVQKLFPEEDFETEGQNALITKIRVPRNIMYLSDRLPKPRYLTESPVGHKDLSTADLNDRSLPLIGQRKGPFQKQPRHSKHSYLPDLYRGLPEESPQPEPARMQRGRIARQYKLLTKKPRKVERVESEMGGEAEASSQPPGEKTTTKPVVVLKNEEIENTPAPAEPGSKSPLSPDDKLLKLLPIQGKGAKQPRQHRQQPKISPAAEPEASESPERNQDYIHDVYIRNLVGKRNPIMRPPVVNNSNIQKIAEIYSGGHAQHIIALQKRFVKALRKLGG